MGLIGVLSIGAVFEYGTTTKDTFDSVAAELADKQLSGGAGSESGGSEAGGGSESTGGSEEVGSIDCYEKDSVGQVGDGGICNGMLIVDTGLLRQAASSEFIGDNSYDFKPSDSYTTHTDGLTYTFADGGDGNIFTGQVDDMSLLFSYDNTFNEDIGYWDTSGVTKMSEVFRDADAFNQDISEWDTSSVTNMFYMFGDALAFNQDLSGWDVNPNVTSCSGFDSNAGDLTPPNFSNCTP